MRLPVALTILHGERRRRQEADELDRLTVRGFGGPAVRGDRQKADHSARADEQAKSRSNPEEGAAGTCALSNSFAAFFDDALDAPSRAYPPRWAITSRKGRL